MTWRGWALALGGILAVLVSLLVPVGRPISDRWGACAWNLLHLPAFFLLTRALLSVFGRVSDPARRLFLSAALALFAGVGSELVQLRVGRSASFHDVALDGFGVALGIFWRGRPGLPGPWNQPRMAIWGLVLLSGVVFAFAPALLMERAERSWSGHLPIIGRFDDEDCLRLWRAQGKAEATADRESGSLRVRLRPGVFGGVNFLPGEQDWSPYSELTLKVSNPGPPLLMGVRIDDRLSAKDRVWLSAEAVIREGDSEIVVPLVATPLDAGKRKVNLSRMTRLVLFMEKVENPVEFSIISAVLR